MFSHYSYNSAEVFLLTRCRQGKEALANIIIPLLFYEMLCLAREDEWKITAKNYILIIFICIAGALTSVFGNVLMLIMLFGNFIYALHRRAGLREIIKAAVLAGPPLLVLGLYMLY